MATSTQTDELDGLRAKIRRSLAELGYGEANLTVGWLDRNPDAAEVLVEVTLPDPGKHGTWDRETTSAIRTAVRTTTAETMPWVVATTLFASAEDDA